MLSCLSPTALFHLLVSRGCIFFCGAACARCEPFALLLLLSFRTTAPLALPLVGRVPRRVEYGVEDCLYFPSLFFLLSPFSPSLPGRAASGAVEDFLGWGDGFWVRAGSWGGLGRVRGDSIWGFPSLLVEVGGVTSCSC